MTDTTVISEKFTATYKIKAAHAGQRKENGFLGNDESSGGYPTFSDRPDPKYLRDNLADAIKDAGMIETTMRSYYGNDEVDFTTIRVVRFKTVIETIDNLEQASHDALVKSAMGKLNREELAALTDAVLSDATGE